jgi:hypothetical protein
MPMTELMVVLVFWGSHDMEMLAHSFVDVCLYRGGMTTIDRKLAAGNA